MILQPEVELAVQDIVNESIVFDDYRTPVKLNLDNYEQSDTIKEKIQEEFKEILSLLDFNNKGIDLYRKWFVDGRLYFHKIVDEKNTKKGIVELRPIDPTRIKKIREVKKEKDSKGIEVVKETNEFTCMICRRRHLNINHHMYKRELKYLLMPFAMLPLDCLILPKISNRLFTQSHSST